MRKNRNFRKSLRCDDCQHASPTGNFVYHCNKFDDGVSFADTCDYVQKKHRSPMICGYKGCDGEVDSLGIEGHICRKCGEHFI